MAYDVKAIIGWAVIMIVAAVVFYGLSTTAYWPSDQQRYLLFSAGTGILGVLLVVCAVCSSRKTSAQANLTPTAT